MRGIFCSILIFSFIFAGCSSGSVEKDRRVVAQVNDYNMGVDDLRYDLKNIPYDEEGFLKTRDGRMEYMERLIEKEILLQEAQRLGLDREKDFMKSIENYWEQALLRLLLQRKSKEISGLMHVYDNEVEEYYKESGEKQPLSKVRDDITKTIRQKKETDAMNAWVEELKKKAYIKINQGVLDEIISGRNR